MKKLVERFAWEYAGDCPESVYFEISGINIWDYDWIDMGKSENFCCPKNNEIYSYRVYKISILNEEIVFGATEYSNCYWGFIEYVDRKKKYFSK